MRADPVPDGLWDRVAPLLPPDPERCHRHPGRLRVPDRTALAITRLLPLPDAVPPIRGLRGRPRRKPRRLYAGCGYDQ
ncbi:hypothetical protein GCM10010357_52720 [Streptomyces luteireticuli]|uniref:Transposase n=1 Tax=Streptomyces luteireticuli TaxID=173858 RepID=A0ABP3ITA5_9ACTN